MYYVQYTSKSLILIMKFYIRMPSSLKPFYNEELEKANKAMKSNFLKEYWHHLERAHILGQPYPSQHSYVHWKMLLFGIKIKSTQEIMGQIPRLLIGGVKSFVGNIPVGNTGGANVPPLQPMEIPKDLQQIIDSNK